MKRLPLGLLLLIAFSASPAQAQNPRTADEYLRRGVEREFRQDLDGAVADYGRAIESDPRLPYAYASRGVTLLLQFKDGEAQKDFDRALQLDPKLKAALDRRIAQAKQQRSHRQQN